MKDKPITIRLEATMYEQIRKLAEDDYRTVSDFVRMVLTKVAKGELKPCQAP